MATSALSVPRLNASFPRPTINRAIACSSETRLQQSYRRSSECHPRIRGCWRDVFVTLPTGSGKSLCYAALPFVLRAQSVVVCPLQCTCTNISFSHRSSHYVIPTRSPAITQYVITVTPRKGRAVCFIVPRPFFAAGE